VKKSKTPTFLLELPLQVDAQQSKHLRAHFEAARGLYSAFLACHLDLRTFVPSIAHAEWESVETRLRAAMEDVSQRANAGEALPQSFGIPRAGVRLPRSLVLPHQELCPPVEDVEAVESRQEPPAC